MIVYTIAFLKNGVVDSTLATKSDRQLMSLKAAARIVKTYTRINSEAEQPAASAVIVPVHVKAIKHVKPPKGVAAPAAGNRRRQRSAAVAAADMN